MVLTALKQAGVRAIVAEGECWYPTQEPLRGPLRPFASLSQPRVCCRKNMRVLMLLVTCAAPGPLYLFSPASHTSCKRGCCKVKYALEVLQVLPPPVSSACELHVPRLTATPVP